MLDATAVILDSKGVAVADRLLGIIETHSISLLLTATLRGGGSAPLIGAVSGS